MTFFHFGNCVLLAYAPFFITFKYSSINEYTSIWKCGQAALVYFFAQFVKMMALATFFPATDPIVNAQDFNLFQELIKASVDIIDVFGLYIAIFYFLSGRSEVRVLAAGLGWAAPHSLANYLISFAIGARTKGFEWKYLQKAVDSNLDILFFMSLAGLVWLFTRNDLSTNSKRLVGLLLVFCVYHDVVYQFIYYKAHLTAWNLLAAKAIGSLTLAVLSLSAYASLGTSSSPTTTTNIGHSKYN